MTPLVTNVTTVLAVLTVIADITIALALIGLLLVWAGDVSTKRFARKIAKHALGFTFFLALGAPIGSLFYSEIAHFAPCELCWWQRIFSYPIVVILAVALWFTRKTPESYKKLMSKHERDYDDEKKIVIKHFALAATFVLALIGTIIAAYHSYGQLLQPDVLPACDAIGVSCAKLYFVVFGYVAIPTMSLTTFLLILVSAAYYFVGKKHEQ